MKAAFLELSLRAAHGGRDLLRAADWTSLCLGVQMDVLTTLEEASRMAWWHQGWMAARPGDFLGVLQECGALRRWMPEISGLFGVPQLSDAAEPVDVGQHQCALLNELAVQGAPWATRWAAMAHKLGKAGTPREIWPSHYKHETRGHVALAALSERWPADPMSMDLAHLVIDEADRIHRASPVRAGAMVALLLRTQALERPERFEQLLQVCTADFAAYEGHQATDYPKAQQWRQALAALRPLTFPPDMSEDDRLHRQAVAVAAALKSDLLTAR